MFFNRGGGAVDWIIVGLGNPGKQYESTRHNMGFLTVDGFCDKNDIRLNKLRFRAWTGTATVAGQKLLVMKPQTYMNLSGEAVGEAARFYKVPADHVLVISDDISLPVGRLRIRAGGSAGGHNGLKNIIAHLGTDLFPRIKIGVGIPQDAGRDTIDWVTERPGKEDEKILITVLDRACEAIPCVMTQGPEKAMGKYNQ